MAVDYTTKASVQQAAVALRERHDALDWSAKIDDLITAEGLSQDVFSPWAVGEVFNQIRAAVRRVAKKVKAIVSVKERLILIAHDLPSTKTPFAKGHELGHSSLPWHREILYVCDEHDLAANTRNQMEFEANTFSSEILLPSPLVDRVYGRFPVSMSTVLLIHEWSGASIEMCAIKYVERHPEACALLMLDNGVTDDGEPELRLTRKTLSSLGAKSGLGVMLKGQRFGTNHNLYRYSRGPAVTETEITSQSSGTRYKVTLFNKQLPSDGFSVRCLAAQLGTYACESRACCGSFVVFNRAPTRPGEMRRSRSAVVPQCRREPGRH